MTPVVNIPGSTSSELRKNAPTQYSKHSTESPLWSDPLTYLLVMEGRIAKLIEDLSDIQGCLSTLIQVKNPEVKLPDLPKRR